MEWLLISLGLLLLAAATRPLRALSRSAPPTPPTPPPPTRAAEREPSVTAPDPTTPRGSRDPLEMNWLDSLLGDSSPAPDASLDDAAAVASVLRIWLAER